ncbi:hypothetical protein C922_04931 [Plasmodium inui San Antonio 1]|uniref:Uncharacterized protein n=1 Tax=Plasmodium inui San Antonio 1 TaxID=1237626 RepID=W6ZZH5_9APIC|nr:hypothetical protein C922_04931 [Plasmodium inui San Antonio 1]EUD64675.1 hypothetical protein C922_04931 [Plasmodium inui San Antonio 1]
MNERHLINNILIKYFVAKRYSKCMYKRRDDPDGGLLRLYKWAKWYKELKTVDSYGQSNERLYVTYTSDKEVKLSHVKQRIIKQKVVKNIRMVFYGCLVLLVVLSCIACLLLYNNHNHVECVLRYGDCPVILHKEIHSFFVNVKMHELSKERILEVYHAMKQVQRKGSNKSEGKSNGPLGQTDRMSLDRRKKYSLLETEKVKCKECQIVFRLEGKEETLEDIFHFEEVNKCEKTIGREHCIHVKDGVISNQRVHLYKRYSGPIKNMDTLEKGAAREKVVLDDKVKFLHPLLKDYVLNLDYFTLRSETGQKIPVNEQPIKEKKRHICHPEDIKTFGRSPFYWLCPQFYEHERGSRVHSIAASIMQMVNIEGAGEADANKHIVEMSKSSPTVRRYDHFGFIADKLELPLKVDIFSRFQPQDGETEKVDMLERIYKAFFCRGRGGSSDQQQQKRHEKEEQWRETDRHHHDTGKHHAYSHSAPSHEDDMSKLAFFFLGHDSGRKEGTETLQGEVAKETYNDHGKGKKLVHIDSTSLNDEERYSSMEDLCREDNYEEGHDTIDKKEKSAEEGEGHTHSRRVLIKEMATVRKDKQKERDSEGLDKELVIISPSVFFGMMEGVLSIVIFFLLLLLGMICVMLILYICVTIGYDVSVLLRDQDEIEEIPRYLKRLSRDLTGGGGDVSVGGIDGGFFRIHRQASGPF